MYRTPSLCRRATVLVPFPAFVRSWEQEDMGLRMLMGMSTLLPNGKIIVQGGAGVRDLRDPAAAALV